jgi:hypothetical protein
MNAALNDAGEKAHGKLSLGLRESDERANEINNSFVLWANPLL